ncbi:MAG: calcium-binding protein [Cyanobacteria bacterium P01_D01_bin.116]
MPKVKRDEIREERISMEAVVDAYNEDERAMGWCYQRIVVALQQTIKLMNKIEQAIPEFPIT